MSVLIMTRCANTLKLLEKLRTRKKSQSLTPWIRFCASGRNVKSTSTADYENLHFHKDWGGYGIIAPDLSKA